MNLCDIKVGEPIWAMGNEDGSIRLYLDCGDGGWINLTQEQAKSISTDLQSIIFQIQTQEVTPA